MNEYRVLMTEPASDDLSQIVEYVAENLMEPITAKRLVGKIKEAVMSLTEIPNRYAVVADDYMAAQGIRKLPINNYLIFYVVSETTRTVTIIRILYSRRNWENLL